MTTLEGKVALVTGASRGIGLAIASELGARGAVPILVARKQPGLDDAVASLAEQGIIAHAMSCHVGRREQVDALFAWIDAELGPVDVLVNNAATNPYFGPMINAEEAAWDKTFDVNLKAPFELSRQVAKRLMAAKRSGSIINVTSIYGMMAAPFQGIYGMTKAAMISLTRTLAHEWGSVGIRVNCVAPGLVETRFAQAILQNPRFVKGYTDRSAAGRVGQPSDIATAVAFLASEDAGWVTGQVLPVDGGYLAG